VRKNPLAVFAKVMLFAACAPFIFTVTELAGAPLKITLSPATGKPVFGDHLVASFQFPEVFAVFQV